MQTRKDRFISAYHLSGVDRQDIAKTAGIDGTTIYRWDTGANADKGRLEKCERALLEEIGKMQERGRQAAAILSTPYEGD